MFHDSVPHQSVMCSSLTSSESDTDIDIGLESSDESFETDDEVELKEDALSSSNGSKRRRLDQGTDLVFPTAARNSEATLMIFDWDDTLLPSTWLQSQALHISAASAAPSDKQKAELSRVAHCVIRTLQRAKRLGHVIIVTNSERGWVELTCRKFLPEVMPLLENIKILSARSLFQTGQAEHPIQWKRKAFHSEIGEFLDASPVFEDACCWKNMVSVGDSMQERVALMEATEGIDCWPKSLKLVERPTPDDLVKQHELLRNCLRPFVGYEGALDMCLEVPRPTKYRTQLN